MDAGDRGVLLPVELLARPHHDRLAPAVGDREGPDHAGVGRLLRRREPLEAEAVAGHLHRLAARERRLGLHRPGLGAGDAEGDQEDPEVDPEASVAAVWYRKRTPHPPAPALPPPRTDAPAAQSSCPHNLAA